MGVITLMGASLTLINFVDKVERRMSDYREDQNHAKNKDYFKDNFIV
jgi:hypothetical protein